MRIGRLLAFCALLFVTVSASGKDDVITVSQANSLVRLVLQHERIQVTSPYCELEHIDLRPVIIRTPRQPPHSAFMS